jgi:hypothetical protein
MTQIVANTSCIETLPANSTMQTARFLFRIRDQGLGRRGQISAHKHDLYGRIAGYKDYGDVPAEAWNDLRGSSCNYLNIGCIAQEGEKCGTENSEHNNKTEADPLRMNVVKHDDG